MKTKPIKTPGDWKTAKPHPYSQITDFGANIDLDGMAKHAKQYGYDEDEALVFYKGMLLDGRHRREVCKRNGVIPPCKEFIGTDEEARAYVLKKYFRQHLSVYDRSKMAALMADQQPGTNQTTVRKSSEVSNDTSAPSLTITQAAQVMDVSKSSVMRAKAELKSLCPRCQRMSIPVKDCPQCAEVRKAKPVQRKKKTASKMIIDWREVKRDLSHMTVRLDNFGRATKTLGSKHAEECQRALGLYVLALRRWYQEVTNEKAPEFWPHK